MEQDVVCPTCGGLIFSSDPDAMRMRPCTCTVSDAPSPGRSTATASRSSSSPIDDLHDPLVDVLRASPPTARPASSRRADPPTPPKPPVASDPAKVCCNCGADINGRKRMKDSQGRYWCYECGKKDEQARQAAAGINKPSKDGRCTLCRDDVFVQDLVLFDGQFICPRCHREQKELAQKTEVRLERVKKTYEKNQWQRLTGLLAVLGILLLIIILRQLGFIGGD